MAPSKPAKAKRAAAKALQAERKKPAVERKECETLLEAEAASAKKKRGRRQEDDRAAVAKIMNDHFRGLSAEEGYVTRINGRTLEEHLSTDRKKWLLGEIKMGKHYYADLKRQYSSEENVPFKQIKVLNPDESDDEELEEALFQASKHMAEHEPLAVWLSQEKLPNQKNSAALMKGLVTFDPYSGPAKNELLLKALRWCATVGFDKKYRGIWVHVQSYFDKVLDKSWSLMKAQGVSAKTWWRSIAEYGCIVLDKAAWEVCIVAEKDWASVKNELKVAGGSIVGQRVFAKGLRDISARATSDLIDQALVTLFAGKDKLTKAALAKHKASVEASLKPSGISLHTAGKAREVTLKYKGVDFLVQITSFLEEYELKLWAILKGAAVSKGYVESLFCEADLTEGSAPKIGGDIDKDLLKAVILARDEAKNFVENIATATAAEVKAALTQQHRVLSALDPTWKVEMNFWLAQCGITGEERLKQNVLKLMPTAALEVSLGECASGIRKLVESRLYQFVGPGAQSEVSTVQTWVKTMEQGRSPSFPKS